MRTHADIVRAAGPAESVADRLGASVHTVRSWINRGRVPAEQWSAFAKEGWATLEELAVAIERRAA